MGARSQNKWAQNKWGWLALGLCSCLVVPVAQAQQTTQLPPGQSSLRTERGESAQSEQVNRFLASCLAAKNQAEVEISQIAARQSKNEQVKEFAQKIVDDHTKLGQELQQLTGMQGGARQLGQQPSNQGTPQSSAQTAQSADSAITQLIAIEKQIVDRVKNEVREKLQQKSGAEFDQCFLGFQVMCHTQMQAALGVIKSETSGQLQQIAQEQEPKIEEHLKKAEELMEQAASASGHASRTEPGQSTR